MDKTTIVVSKRIYDELLMEKRRIGAKSINETIERILLDYKKLRRIVAIYEIIEKNKEDRRISLEELLRDRRKFLRREFS